MKSPAFQFYPKDWLSSRRVRMMTDQQRGWYIQLICEAWESEVQATLPNDPKILWILAGASSEQMFNTCSTPVIDMFENRNGTLICHRLVEEVAKQEQMRELRAKAGRESGKVRRETIKHKHLARLNKCSTNDEHKANTPSSIASASASASAIAIASTKEGSPSDMPEGAFKAMSSKQSGIRKRSVSPVRWQFLKQWDAAFQAKFCAPYMHQGEKDDKCADKLLSHLPNVEELMRIVKLAWGNLSDFNCKQSITISGFYSRFNDIRAKIDSKRNHVSIGSRPASSADILSEYKTP